MEKYYKILEIHANATEQEVKQAYRDLVKVWHPDRFTHDIKLQNKAEEKLKEINDAYQRIVAHLNNSRTGQQSQQYQRSETQEKSASQPPPKQSHNSWICPECLKTNYIHNLSCGCGFRSNEIEINSYRVDQTSADLYDAILFNRGMNYTERANFLARYLLRRFPSSREAEILRQGSDQEKSYHKKTPPPNRWRNLFHKRVSRWYVIPGSIIFTVGLSALISSLINTDSSKQRRPEVLQPSMSADKNIKTPFSQPFQPIPINGAVKRYVKEEAIAPLKITTRESGNHYFVKIVDWYTNKIVCTVFIRSGQSFNLKVPLGSYKLKYATGEKWYGMKFLFGPETAYSVADKQFIFEVRGDHVSGYTVELFLQPHGNLKTNKITAEEFE